MINVIMGHGGINTPRSNPNPNPRSNPNPHKHRIERRQKKVGGDGEVRASIEEILKGGGATPSKKKKPKQENKPVINTVPDTVPDTVPEIVIQKGDG